MAAADKIVPHANQKLILESVWAENTNESEALKSHQAACFLFLRYKNKS